MNRTQSITAAAAVTIVAAIGLFIGSNLADQTTDDGTGTPYILLKSDNICGISDPRGISNPARVSYARVFAATPQSRRMKREGIDPSSAQGIILTSQAEALLRDTCLAIRERRGYCSVWKLIRRRDGTPIPDITREVLEVLDPAVGTGT